jgi:chemotaxis protein CheD
VKHIVGVADMKVARDGSDVIVTHGLGSCLGVTLYDPATRVGAMLHTMMPASSANPVKAKANPFMFVDTGIPALLEAMRAAGASKGRWQLKVAGGAAVNGNDHFAIGRRNYVSLKKLLWRHGLLIDGQDVGGSVARTMHLDLKTGRVWLNGAGKQWEL